jgi:hypothetical protein
MEQVVGARTKAGVYRCDTVSVEGFVQQLAVSYLRHGYWFYVTGMIPPDREQRVVDEKLISLYDITSSKWSRAWRKSQGRANMQYVRYQRFFVLLATHGEHEFFQREGEQVRDARRVPIKFAGYAISVRGGHAHVRIEREEYKRVQAYFENLAVHRDTGTVERELRSLRYVPYAPVRRQYLLLLRRVNRVRKTAGLELVSRFCLSLRRAITAPFGIPLEKANASPVSRSPSDTWSGMSLPPLPVPSKSVMTLLPDAGTNQEDMASSPPDSIVRDDPAL